MVRLYSLYIRNGKRWERISDIALPKQQAIVFFQNALLNSIFNCLPEHRLRPVK